MRMLDLIHHSNLIEEIDDPAEDEQSWLAWKMLVNEPQLTHGLICRVQKMITLHQPLRPDQRGYYRNLSRVNVFVGKHVPPAYPMIDGMMDNWLLDFRGITPREAHVRFERIHPFVDGNGRTGRMLMWWQELRDGELPTMIRFEEREQYYGWFEKL